MDTSDDVLGLGGGGSDIDLPPPVKAGNLKKTAKPVDQVSEQSKRNRRLAASALTRGFAPPTLGQPGLLGLSRQN
jgi:hypothetical protein